MKFSIFFHTWLHENYYKNAVNIGKNGDFFTAVSVGNLFGTLLAQHFLNLVDKKILKLPLELVEIGANEGYLSRDFLAALLELRPQIFSQISFFIIEPHEKLRTLQKKTLEGVEFTHKNNLKECRFKNAFFFCNELFDSFACELIDDNKMAFVENFKLVFKNMDANLIAKCKTLNLKKGELSLELEDFFKDLNQACDQFIFAGFDYGIFNPQKFSLRIYQKHEVFNPFEISLKDFFGKSDLTYNVNFTQVQNLIKEFDFKLLAFKKQSLALMDFGFEKLLEHAKNKNIKTYESFLSQAKILFFNFDEKFHFFEFQKN
ncbi:TPA: SAM-dependent methyltransferase [Campylobacter jejuni]|nr:SAM-dependent methyltransferase [Campylobacter jejuni]HDZ5087665.1 SAM-dependent methyltransferase [Campylobacter jejuni]HDZ5090572.1 SAM-dependent methyltransferase [Campylobacter jejuni]HDZ5092176.1 SAM-dependent methyltransferase [Campylobacter jejuni]HDZ5100408.1 SAM-dependent methyltransferase [Campylobacter jejuni]